MLFAALVSNLLEGESENAGETGLMIPYVGFITLTCLKTVLVHFSCYKVYLCFLLLIM